VTSSLESKHDIYTMLQTLTEPK